MDQVKELIAGIMAMEVSELPPTSTALRDIDGWDSLKHVSLVVGMEKKLKTKLSAPEIQSMVTLDDVARVLKDKGAGG